MHIEYDGDPFEDRPEGTIDRFEETVPRPRRQSEIGPNANHLVWEFDQEGSKWFQQNELVRLDPGQYTAFQSHLPDVEGPKEVCLRIFDGRARLRTEYWDETLERFDTVLIPPNTAYQIGNPTTEPLWYAAIASVGDNEVPEASSLPVHERPGAAEEYRRIMAARKERGLPTPEDAGDYDGDPEKDRPEPEVRPFSETFPVHFTEALETTGANSNRNDWITSFEHSEWITQNSLLSLEPGEYVSMHAHFDNEGPYEENYWIIDGKARLQTEYWDTTLHKHDCAFFTTGVPHGLGNCGTDTLWFAAWSSKGGHTSDFDIDDVETSERPGLKEEYRRVMAARKKRGLPLPPHVDVDLGE
ncbi:cupin domain-containing protein [Halorarius litoreus]|uniref:cupin domain-containing protein n=1 Tax=Halorarius litoreus TaxID=2962676 RepID=UPI0020CDD2B5|nr:cupin domain-containing protein [Halorarius litoreus]